MNIDTIKALGEIAKVLSVTALLWLALWGNFKGWWVSGREHKAVVDDRDRLRAELAEERAGRNAISDSAAHALDRLATVNDDHPANR